MKQKVCALFFSLFSLLTLGRSLVYADGGYISSMPHYEEGGVAGFLKRFYTPGAFEAHNTHFYNDELLMWVLIVANLLIFLAYTIIPIVIVYFLRKRQDLAFRGVFWLFGAFIILCGLHHLVHVMTFWYPVYYLQGAIDTITALVSLATAVALFAVMPIAIRIRGPDELQKINDELKKEVEERRSAQEGLKKQQEELENALEESRKAKEELEEINKLMVGRELKMSEMKKRIEELESQLEN